jgi:hypothetical protein
MLTSPRTYFACTVYTLAVAFGTLFVVGVNFFGAQARRPPHLSTTCSIQTPPRSHLVLLGWSPGHVSAPLLFWKQVRLVFLCVFDPNNEKLLEEYEDEFKIGRDGAL